MEAALHASRAIAAGDGVAAGMIAYLERHIEEERGHDEWLLEDLEALGVSRAEVRTRAPADSTARAVGAQYYWIRHDHPVALLGYVAVVEGRPPSVAFLDEIVARTGLPSSAFRTLYRHAESDVGHGRDLETRKRACDAIFATATAELAPVFDRIPLGISLEMQEIDAVLTCKKNNLHEYVKRREPQAAS